MSKFLVVSLISVGMIAISCTDSNPTSSLNYNPKDVSIQSINPYEWVGIAHNLGLDYYRTNFTWIPLSQGNWVDQSFVDSSLAMSSYWYDSVFDDYWPGRPSANTDLIGNAVLNGMFARIHNMDSLTARAHQIFDTLTPYAACSQKSVDYIKRMVAVAKGATSDTSWTVDRLLDSIAAIECDILADSWGSGDMAARCAIAIFKHSGNYWASEYHELRGSGTGNPWNSSKGNDGHVSVSDQTKKGIKTIAEVCTDVVVGCAVFGSITGGTGGVGVAGGAWAGVKAGVSASGAVSLILGWW